MARKDPVNDALLNLTELHYRDRRAQLDAEYARSRKDVESRGAVAGVFAQLQEQREKEAKKREQIAQRGQQGQASPAAMAPPLTNVSGQTTGRDPSAALAAGGELLNAVLGGGGIKRGMIQGGFGQTTNPPGMGQGTVPGPVGPQAGQAAPAPTTPAQAGVVVPNAPTTATTFIPSPDPLSRRLGRAVLNILGGRLGSSSLGETLVPEPGGVQVTQRIPTEAEEAERIAKDASTEARSLSVLLREAQEKQGKKEAGEIGKRIVQNIDDIQKRRGDVVTREAVRQAGLEVLAEQQEEREALRKLYIEEGGKSARAREKESRKQADPSEREKDVEATIFEMIARGEDPATKYPGWRDYLAEKARMDPIRRIESEIARGSLGQPPKAATQADVDRVWADLSKKLGRDATREEIKAELAQQGFSFGP